MNKICAVTSFSPAGFNEYGKTMVETFIKYWPDSVKLVVYLDDEIADKPVSKNVEYRLLENPVLDSFKQRNQHRPEANGLGSKRTPEGKCNFTFDAVKFSHKVFAVIEVYEKDDVDVLIWLDGDSKTHSPVTVERIESWVPATCFAGFLDRPWLYTETGFHIFRTKHVTAKDFFARWKQYYSDDSIFQLEAWTDCHTYDAARRQFPQKHWYNLSPRNNHPHPFINGCLGEVMDHMKGPRKKKGSSHWRDLVSKHNSEYWKTVK